MNNKGTPKKEKFKPTMSPGMQVYRHRLGLYEPEIRAYTVLKETELFYYVQGTVGRLEKADTFISWEECKGHLVGQLEEVFEETQRNLKKAQALKCGAN